MSPATLWKLNPVSKIKKNKIKKYSQHSSKVNFEESRVQYADFISISKLDRSFLINSKLKEKKNPKQFKRKNNRSTRNRDSGKKTINSNKRVSEIK